ncbi:uncharacterized protein LOC135938510 isoform X1 [Cloeon dipterum]|uniref:uncharacterized protein LOC135938510 isoform X1 n=1 Tax=Cloeon dipterum TaxID=197152 RepID=UPI00321FAB8F
MNSATLRNVAIISTIIFFFSVGVEYGAFLPNVIEHFHNIGIQNEALLGIVLACYWFGCCISSNVLLLLIDTNYPLRPLLLVCCVLYIASGLLYLFAPSLWAVVFSKFFAGLGAGSVLAIEKDLSASTSAEEFAALRLRLHVSLACGWLLSPIFSVLGLLVSPSLASSEVVSSSFFVLCAILTVLGFTHLARNLRLCRLRDTLALAYQKRSSMNKSYGAFSVSYDSPDLGEERFDQTSESCSLIIAKDFSTPLKISDDVSSQNKLNRQKSEKHGSRDPMLTNSDEILETAEFFMGPQARMPQEIMPPDVTHNCTDFSSTPPSPSEPPFDATCYPSSALNFSRSATAVCQKYRTNWLCPQFLSAFLFGSLQHNGKLCSSNSGFHVRFAAIAGLLKQLKLSENSRCGGLLPGCDINHRTRSHRPWLKGQHGPIFQFLARNGSVLRHAFRPLRAQTEGGVPPERQRTEMALVRGTGAWSPVDEQHSRPAQGYALRTLDGFAFRSAELLIHLVRISKWPNTVVVFN